MNTNPDVVDSTLVSTPIGIVYVAPNRVAHATTRIGERRDGVLIATAELSDREVAAAGLTGRVARATDAANRLAPLLETEP